MLATTSPFPQFFDADGEPLDNGSLYFGTVNLNPETNPQQVYWDAAGSQPAAQPIKVMNGYTVRNGTPANVYTALDYSLLVRNRRGLQVLYVPSSVAYSNDLALQSQIDTLNGQFTTLAGSGGSSMVGFIQSGSGAVAASMQSWARRRPLTPEDFGAAFNNLSVDSTAAVQACIDASIVLARPMELLGQYSVGPLDFNGTGHATPPNSEYVCINSVRGVGRFGTCGFVARAGLYGSNQYVVTARNFSGKTFHNFSVSGNSGVTKNAIDFAWIGGSGGNPAIAPASNNTIRDIYADGTVNLDQCHDSVVDGIWVRNVLSTDVAFSMQGAGGQITASRIYVASGLTQLSCQNGGISDSGFFGGLLLTGSGYNHFVFDDVHFYQDPANGACINSTATGNATRGCVFNGCYFNPCTFAVRGRWHEGATFNGTKFQAWTAFADPANLVPASGAGNRPTFAFKVSSFEGTLPVSVTSLYKVDIESCRDNAGNVVTGENVSFTSTALGGTTPGTTTYTTQTGVGYKKDGFAFVQLRLTWTAATGTGRLTFGGLPWSASAVAGATIAYPGATFGGALIFAQVTANTIIFRGNTGADFAIPGTGDVSITAVYPTTD